MARQFAAGVDIGTHHVKAVIAEEVLQDGRVIPKIIGTGIAESRGLQHGYIVNQSEVAKAIRTAVSQAEKAAALEVKRAFVSVGGVGLAGITTVGTVAISRADMELTELDLDKAGEAAEAAIPQESAQNRRIINTIPVEIKVDGRTMWGRVEGLKASKIEVKTLFITCLEHHLEDLIVAVEEAGIEVVDVVAAPIAASFVTLTKKQKKAGCILANIGAETLSIVVFENGTPVSLEVFQIGSQDLTHDIALGLKTSLEEAESIKIGALTRTNVSKKKLDDIISARLSDMFELIEGHLKKIGRNALLPAGIIFTGGGSSIPGLKEHAEQALKLPATIGAITFGGTDKLRGKDATWAVAYGLAILGFNAENERGNLGLVKTGKLAERGRKGLQAIASWFSRFLP